MHNNVNSQFWFVGMPVSLAPSGYKGKNPVVTKVSVKV